MSSRAALAFLLAGAAACSKQAPAPAGPQRFAILPVENLTGDPAFDGLARGLSHLIRFQIGGRPGVAAVEALSPSEAWQRQATRIVHTSIEKASQGLLVHAALRTPAGVTEKETSAAAAEASALAFAVAKWLDPRANPGPAISTEALAAFGEALAASDRARAIELLKKAVSLAPGFGDASLALSALLNASGDRSGAKAVLDAALARNPDPISRARLSAQLATLSGDADAALAAREQLASLVPSEPGLLRQTAEMRLARGEFPAAIEAYRKAAEAEPANAENWNQLAFAYAYSDNEKSALDAIARYETARPESANPLDSRGEIQFLYGRFREAAESFAAAYAKDPAFLQGATLAKGAQARLFAGDIAAAGRDFRAYLDGPAKGHPLAALIEAQWEFKSGRRDQAIGRLKKLDRPEALTQLAFWHLELGQRTAASGFARQAAAKAQTPAAKNEANIAAYLSQPSAAAEEWRRRAGGNPPPVILAYALVFDRKWKDAIPVLTQLVTQTHPFRAGHWRVLLGQAHLETGNLAEARKWLRFYPIPMSSGEAALECAIVPKVIELRRKAGL